MKKYSFQLNLIRQYFFKDMGLVIIWAFFSVGLTNFMKLHCHFNVWDSHYSTAKYLKENGLLIGYSTMVLKMPFIEEMSFRLWLNLKKNNIVISIGFALYLFLGLFYSTIKIEYRLAISIVIGIVSFFLLAPISQSSITEFYQKYSKQIYWFSIVLFGLAHITNFRPIDTNLWFVYLFFIIPQLIGGYFMTKIRFELGIFWSYLYHVINNTIPFLFSAITLLVH